jgi:carboxyl-terminal processing protease
MTRNAALAAVGGLALLTLAAVLAVGMLRPSPAPVVSAGPAGAPVERAPERAEAETRAASLAPPREGPARLACQDLERVMAQVLGELVEDPMPVEEASLAASVRDWLDPHGFWTAAPDSEAGKRMGRTRWNLRIETAAEACREALEVGATLEREVGDLGAEFDEARAGEGAADASEDPWLAATTTVFEATKVTREAVHLAHILGRRAGAVERALGPSFAPIVDAGRRRFFPALGAGGWAEAVQAALLRSWVVLVDPHGDWAPNGEEAGVLELDLEASATSPLWTRYARTAVGLRVDEGAEGGLRDGDVVVELGGHATMGLTPEQVEQLRWHLAYERKPFRARVLRRDPLRLEELAIDLRPAEHAEAVADESLQLTRIPYGERHVAIIAVPDVRTDLGDELGRVLRALSREEIAGIVLDLRGNGGGATDGASGALGHFLPGAPLFALRRRDGTLEVQEASAGGAGSEGAWSGPLAVFVDGATASAAEMIGGALATYGRAVLVGAPTFGKGCAQEYLDDVADAGVLRVTTLVYALPDGSPVQRVGLKPRLVVDAWRRGGGERERDLRGAPKTWQGPDIRDRRRLEAPVVARWPNHLGRVGPCAEASVCHALRLLGQSSVSRRTP